MSGRAAGAGPELPELVSIAERLNAMRVLRAGLALAVLAAGGLAPGVRTVPLATLVGVTVLYLLLLLPPSLTRRLSRTRLLQLLAATLLLDGAYLAWVTYATGGTRSPLGVLVFVHIVAVTLLGSHRTGLKVAAWHVLLFLVTLYAQAAGLLAAWEGQAVLPGGDAFAAVVALRVGGMWVVAIGTAAFSAMNERELRGQKADLAHLSAMVRELESRDDPSDIPRILLRSVCGVFGFTRGAVLASPRGELSLLASTDPVPPALPPGLDPLMEQAWTRRQTLLVSKVNPESDPRLAALFPGCRNLMVVPLSLDRGYRLGILAVDRCGGPDRIRRWQVAMVEQFAAHAAQALHNAWLVREVESKLRENRALQARLRAQNLALEARVEERTSELRDSLRDLSLVDRQRRTLLARLVTAEEQERRRIADDIHDGPVQDLVAAFMDLDVARRTAPHQEDLAAVDAAMAAITRSIEGLRSLLFELRPTSLDRDGLEAALVQYLRTLEGGLSYRIDARLREEPPADVGIILYRVAQEALANVRKHARASNVEVLLDQRDGGYLIRIRDDGVGFDPPAMLQSAPGHLGLSSMRERAEMGGGRCEVRSLPGAGTTVQVWVPGTPLGRATGTVGRHEAPTAPREPVGQGAGGGPP